MSDSGPAGDADIDLRRTRDVLTTLRDPATIRLRAAAITRAVDEGRSGHFTIDRGRLPAVAERVVALMRRRFPDGRVPLHSRWRHFEAGGVDRKGELDALLAGASAADRARAQVDLTVISVLLDAGAGPQWRYSEHRGAPAAVAMPAAHLGRDDLLAMLDQAASGELKAGAVGPPVAAGGSDAVYSRSEGLAVASFRAFVAGAFSARPGDPCRADAATLTLLDATALRAMFQASPSNPLVGLEGRAGLMARLGRALHRQAAADGLPARPSRIVDRVTEGFTRDEVSAAALLREVLTGLAPIWTSGSTVGGVLAGDVWMHRWAGGECPDGRNPLSDLTRGWVPFHKLSQWLTYSLVEPLQWAGVHVTGLQVLTGLPEYRNGGLLLDAGVIVPREPRDLARLHKPGDEFVVEWRALTVQLLDEVAVLVRQAFGKTEDEMPLPCILEGGTWAAGREIARELRGDGAPPLRIESDGTLF